MTYKIHLKKIDIIITALETYLNNNLNIIKTECITFYYKHKIPLPFNYTTRENTDILINTEMTSLGMLLDSNLNLN